MVAVDASSPIGYDLPMQVTPAHQLYTGAAGEAFAHLAAHPTYKAICNAIVWDGVVDRLNHSHRRAFVLGGKPEESLDWPCVAYQVAAKSPMVEQSNCDSVKRTSDPIRFSCDFKDLACVINSARFMGFLSSQPTAFILRGHTLGNQAMPDEERPCLAFLSTLRECLGLDDVLLVDVALASCDDPRLALDGMPEVKRLEEKWYRAAGFPEVQRRRVDLGEGYRIDTCSGDTLILARVRYHLEGWLDLCESAGFVVEQVITGEAYGAKSAGLLLRRAHGDGWREADTLTKAQIDAQRKRGGWWLAKRPGELRTVRLSFRDQISYLYLDGWLVRPCSPTGETYKYGDALP